MGKQIWLTNISVKLQTDSRFRWLRLSLSPSSTDWVSTAHQNQYEGSRNSSLRLFFLELLTACQCIQNNIEDSIVREMCVCVRGAGWFEWVRDYSLEAIRLIILSAMPNNNVINGSKFNLCWVNWFELKTLFLVWSQVKLHPLICSFFIHPCFICVESIITFVYQLTTIQTYYTIRVLCFCWCLYALHSILRFSTFSPNITSMCILYAFISHGK